MNARWMLRALGCVVVAGGTAAAMGCSGSVPEGTHPEKVAATQEAVISYTSPTPTQVFPNQTTGLEKSADCVGRSNTTSGILQNSFGENFVAMPTTVAGSDPYMTTYTHGFQHGVTNCSPGDLTCQLANDFFSIPGGHGFKYLVKQIPQGSISSHQSMCGNPMRGMWPCTIYDAKTTISNWHLMPVQRMSNATTTYQWSYYPWWDSRTTNCGVGHACPAPWTEIDSTSHPNYGADGRSSDWNMLWNLAWTYSYQPDPWAPQPPNNTQTSKIEATHHQCAVIYHGTPVLNGDGTPVVNQDGTYQYTNLQLLDFQPSVLDSDPGGCGAGCW